ncbi:hypothetical protein SDC9_79390 [bioreactor metagenome]|uniref:Uncharacterized protein n=1 Tax=bioreactor metagenome TaxID=1076179 RepID=A0A644Z3Y4_9ZZZZ
MSIRYHRILMIIILPIIFLNVYFKLDSSILLSTLLFIISFIGFKLRKSKDIKLSLIALGFLFALANLYLGL